MCGGRGQHPILLQISLGGKGKQTILPLRASQELHLRPPDP